MAALLALGPSLNGLYEQTAAHAFGSAKGREKRPAFDRLCKDAVRRRFDVVMAWSIDRVGRRVKDVATFMAEMEELGVSQYYEKQAIDSSTTYGKGMLHMAAVFAELERDVIRDRVIAGIERAKVRGTKSGRAIGRPRVDLKAEAAIRASLLAGAPSTWWNPGPLRQRVRVGSRVR